MSSPSEVERVDVLVVEDDASNREVIMEVLLAEGYSVAGAEDGADALRWLADRPPPSLILLDLMMPVMNGWEFRSAQRADPRIAAIPVVLVSAGAFTGEAAEGFGAIASVRKPVRLDELLATVRRCCR